MSSVRIRLDGAPKLAMMCNVLSALITVVLGYLFIFPLGWGLKGAALAATLGLLIGSVTGLVYLFCFAKTLRPYRVKWSIKSMRLSFRNLGYQCRIGSSALLTEATMAIEGFPYFSAAFVFFIFNLTVIGYYQSLEKMRHATVLALLRGFIFLIPSFILLPKAIGAHGIWLALCFSELLTTLTIVVIYGAGVLKNTRFSDY